MAGEWEKRYYGFRGSCESLKLYLEYTVQEYIRFYDFYKNQEVSEENTEAFYVMLQTKLMILRKYDYNRVSA